MAWYRVTLEDGTSKRLWFGHDPSEEEVYESLEAPGVRGAGPSDVPGPEPPTAEQEAASILESRRENEPNRPEQLATGAMFAASPLPMARAASTLGKVLTHPAAIGGAAGALPGAVKGDPEAALRGGAAGAVAGATGQGIARVLPMLKFLRRFKGGQIPANAPQVPGATMEPPRAASAPPVAPRPMPSAAPSFQEGTGRLAEMLGQKPPVATVPAASSVAAKVTAQWSPTELGIIKRLRDFYQSSGANKDLVLKQVKESFPNDWQIVLAEIKRPNTTMPSIRMPAR